MNKRLTLVWLAILSLVPCLDLFATQGTETRGSLDLSVPFIMNQGQANEGIAYYAPTFGGTFSLTEHGEIVYAFPASTNAQEPGMVSFSESLLGAERNPVRGENRAATRINYFLGNDSRAWLQDIPAFHQLSLDEAYPGITVKLRARTGNVEKLFLVQPGARPETIRLQVQGAQGLQVSDKGELEVVTQSGSVHFTRPVAYQEIAGQKRLVVVNYFLDGHEYGFTVGSYDRTQPLVIDPLIASTFLGGSGNDRASEALIDADGNIYLCGDTTHASFPTTPGSYDQTFAGTEDAFLVKVDKDCTTLLAATFIGGDQSDMGNALAMGLDGSLYLAGQTKSTDFPTHTGAFDETHNGFYDLFLVRLDSSLSTLLGGTYVGGVKKDATSALAINAEGEVFLSGQTMSLDFPMIPGALSETHNGGTLIFGEGSDLCVAKFDPALETLLAATYVGGSDCDIHRNMILDGEGGLYLVGQTMSTDFPISPGAFDATFHGGSVFGGDAYVCHLDEGLTTLLASTYIGSSGDDWSIALCMGADNDLYVTGDAFAGDFPTTPGAFDQTYHGGMYGDGIVVRFSRDLTTLLASTFIGGVGGDYGVSIFQDSDGSVYTCGITQSPDFPTTPGCLDATFNGGDRDIFISKLDADLTTLSASTFLGGNAYETGGILPAPDGSLLVRGHTVSNNFPTTPGAIDSTYNGGTGLFGGDLFLAKIDRNLGGSLYCDTYSLSGSSGGIVNLFLDATTSNSGRTYLILGSRSGTEPGLPLPGGLAALPLNWDNLTDVLLNQLNTPLCASFMDSLDSEGKGSARLQVSSALGLINEKVHFAYLLDSPFDFVSNPVSVEVLP